MKFGPTSANQLPARLVWCKSPEAKARLAAHAMDKNQPKITGAPVCVIVGMDLEFHEQLPWLFPHTDARSWFLKEELRHANAAAVDAEFFADQPNVKSNFICAIGYGDPASIFGRSPRPEFDVFNKLL
jgi:nitroreductase